MKKAIAIVGALVLSLAGCGAVTAGTVMLSVTAAAPGGGCSGDCGTVDGEIVLPLDVGFSMTDNYGPRRVPVKGASKWHPADDLQNWPNPCGRPVYAMLPGTVVESSRLYLSIAHPDGYVISYLHSHKSDRLVKVGDDVEAGQVITRVGNEAPSSGCHLDIRINTTNSTNAAVSALPKSEDLGAPAGIKGWVDPEAFFALFGVDLCPVDVCRRNYSE